MFGKILGAVGGVAGAIASNKASKRAAKQAELDRQARLETERQVLQRADQVMSFGQRAYDNELALLDYVKDQNAYNQWAAQDQTNYGRRVANQQRRQLLGERQFDIGRMATEDEALSRERARRLEAAGRNADITQSERDFAIQQLLREQGVAADERAFDIGRLYDDQARLEDERDFGIGELRNVQQIAQDERDFDISRLNENQSRKDAERAFQIEEYYRQRGQATDERNYDIGQRELMRAATDRLSSALSSTLTSLGPRQTPEFLGRADIEDEVYRREGTANALMDKIIDRTASVNEADLIRSGMDRSTTGNAKRAAMAARLAPELQKLQDDARSEAIRYVTGVNDSLRMPGEFDRASRMAALDETGKAYGSALDYYGRLPEVRSAVSAGPSFSSVGSSIYDRDIASAGNFRAPVEIGSTISNRSLTSQLGRSGPVDIRSGVYGGLEIDYGTGLSARNPSSAANFSPYNTGASFNFQLPNMSQSSGFFQQAGSMMGGLVTASGAAAQSSATNAATAAQGAGGAFANAITQVGALGDKLWPNLGKKTGASPSSGTNS
jgi:hypothetical protein